MNPSDFTHGSTPYRPIEGVSINPRAAQSREARREIARQEAVAARFSDPEQVEANRARQAHMAAQQRRNDLMLKVENLDRKIAAASADLVKAEQLKAAAESRIRSLREAERELAEMVEPSAGEPVPVEVVEPKRGPGRPKRGAA